MTQKCVDLNMQRDPYHRTEAQRRTEEQVMKFEACVKGRLTSLSNFVGFDTEVDRTVLIEGG